MNASFASYFGFFFLFLTALPASFAQTQAQIDALKKSDFYRGGTEGVTWNVRVQNIEKDNMTDDLNLLVEAASDVQHVHSLITFVSPQKFEGQRLLLRDNNMWFMKKGLMAPVPISGRQRLSGRASNADVASSNYYKDYDITTVEEAVLDNKPCWLLNLTAKNNLVTYPQVKYWLTKDDNFGIKAEYYGKSDKLIKSAVFEYGNTVNYKGKGFRYLSRIIISDMINTSDRTVLNISNVRFTAFNKFKFEKDRLMD